VKLSRQSLTLQFLCLNHASDRVPGHPLRELDCYSRARRKRLGQAKIVVGETSVRPLLVVDLENPDHPIVSNERNPHARPHGELSRHFLVNLRIVDHGIAPLAAPAPEYRAALGFGSKDRVADDILGAVSSHSGEPEVIFTARQRETNDPGSDQVTQPSDDEVEQSVEIGFRRECVADLLERLQLP
jgi:hypothetical protein